MNKIIKTAAVGLCSTVLGICNIQPISAAIFAQCENYINIRKQPDIQSTIVGYIYNNNIAEILNEDEYGWIKIKSGNVIGWVAKQYFIQSIPAFDNTYSYTVALIHSDNLSVYADPNKESTIYTTVYQNQQIECVEYKDGWLTLAFEDGFYGFIDAYQAELKTYYGTAKTINEIVTFEEEVKQQIVDPYDTYDIYNQSGEDYQEIMNYNDYIQYQEEYYEQQNFNEKNTEYIITEQEYNQEEYQEYYQQEYQQEQQQEEYQEQQYQEIYQQQEQYQEYYEYEQEQYYEEQNNITNNSNNDIVSYADQYIGNPYSYGGNSLTNGIDCSHFVWQVLSNTGHYNGQYATSDGWASLGENVNSLDDAVAGDVIVYPGHVAIYDGQGGIVQAQGSASGITHTRTADHTDILAIRHFD